MKKREQRRSWLTLRVKFVALVVAVALLPLLWVGTTLTSQVAVRLDADTQTNRREWLEWLARDLAEHVESLHKDTLAVSEFPPVLGLVRARDHGAAHDCGRHCKTQGMQGLGKCRPRMGADQFVGGWAIILPSGRALRRWACGMRS